MIPACPITDAVLIDLGLDGRLIPVMICRMIISLKKVASSLQQSNIDTELSVGLPMSLQDTGPPRAVDTIRLSVFKVTGLASGCETYLHKDHVITDPSPSLEGRALGVGS